MTSWENYLEKDISFIIFASLTGHSCYRNISEVLSKYSQILSPETTSWTVGEGEGEGEGRVGEGRGGGGERRGGRGGGCREMRIEVHLAQNATVGSQARAWVQVKTSLGWCWSQWRVVLEFTGWSAFHTAAEIQARGAAAARALRAKWPLPDMFFYIFVRAFSILPSGFISLIS